MNFKPATSTDTRHDTNGAPACDAQKCRLPGCWCSEGGTAIPGNLTAPAVPQMITISFDDAVNADNFELYSSKSRMYGQAVTSARIYISYIGMLTRDVDDHSVVATVSRRADVATWSIRSCFSVILGNRNQTKFEIACRDLHQ